MTEYREVECIGGPWDGKTYPIEFGKTTLSIQVDAAFLQMNGETLDSSIDGTDAIRERLEDVRGAMSRPAQFANYQIKDDGRAHFIDITDGS